MLACVVIDRQQPRQPRKSRPIRAWPRPALLTNIPTCKPSAVQTSLILPGSHSHFGTRLIHLSEIITPIISYIYVGPILQPLCFDGLPCNGGCTPLHQEKRRTHERSSPPTPAPSI